MEPYLIDEVDQQIIDRLREDGRASLASIGADIGLSPDAVRARMGRLTGDGVLRVIGLVHPGTLGYESLGTVALSYQGATDQLLEQVKGNPSITFMAQTLGEANAICEITARHDAELSEVVTRDLATIPGVTVREVWRSLAVIKWDSQARPLALTTTARTRESLDEVDVVLLRELVANPRASYRELEATTGQPYWVVRRRTQALFADGVIHASAIVDRLSANREVQAHLAIGLTGDWTAGIRELCQIPEVTIVTLTAGRSAATAEITCASSAAMAETIRQVTAVDCVQSVSNYLYSRILVLPMPWRFDAPAG